jgi:hypothetical protein
VVELTVPEVSAGPAELPEVSASAGEPAASTEPAIMTAAVKRPIMLSSVRRGANRSHSPISYSTYYRTFVS